MRIVRVQAPSRLHFGMLSFGHPGARQFGGVGVMIDRPSLRLQISTAEELVFSGPMAERARQFAQRWAAFHKRPAIPAFAIQVLDAPSEHVGLGCGTQLALSVGAALNAFFGVSPSSPAELAISVGRGVRSAVGTYGFAGGGLIAEKGKLPGEPIAPLDCRVDMPSQWRFVVICAGEAGMSGADEQTAFDRLPAVPADLNERLIQIVAEQLFPAAAMSDFDEFSDGLYHYSRTAGNCFAAQQGGPYNGARLTEIVKVVREMGVRGVGQSSWGPTLFALTESADDATALANQLRDRLSLADGEVWTAAANNRGSVISVEE